MSLFVNNNSTAFNVFSSYSNNLNGLRTSMGRLSSGVKSVRDDAAGVAISERMRSQSRATSMARMGVENGLSMLQTADSYMQKINDMLGRMHELAVEASDGTKTATDKGNIQTEFKELQDEIVRVTSRSTSAAKFNGLYLLRGGNGQAVTAGDKVGSGGIKIQVGADNGQTISLTMADLQVTATATVGTVHSYTYSTNNTVKGSTHTAVKWNSVIDSTKFSVGSADAIGKLSSAIDYIANNRATIGAQQNRLENTRSGLLAYEDNLRASESKIRDVDMARESTTLAKYQILSQVGNAMLAQAGQLPQAALRLIG